MTNRGVANGVGGTTLGRGGRRLQVADPLGKNDAVSQRYADQVGLGLPSYVASLALKNKYSVDRGLYNFKSSNTRRLDQGRADAMVGGITRHLVLGDSVTDGYTSFVGSTTIDHARAWPLAMRDQMGVSGIPANGTGFVKMADNTAFDTRWLRTGTWSNQTSWVFSNAAASTTTYVAERPGTILDVWYLNSTSTFTVSIDGAASGTNFATVTGTTSGAWVKWRMYGVTINTGSVIKITLTVAGAGIGLSGASIWTPNAGVVVDNLGMGGAKASGTGAANFADLASGPLVVQRYVGGKSTTITDAATTSGANTITSASSSFNATGDTLLGEPVDQFPDATGALFPPNTYITGRTSATVLTTNNNALVTTSAKTLRIGRDPHCVHIALGGNDTQTSGVGGANVEAPAAAIKTIAALYPNSDIILHLENQGSSVLWTTGDYTRWQQRIYLLADELDVPLYDWYDRTGPYATALANGVFQDYQAHMIPGIYADLGSSLAQAMGGGSGQPQYFGDPVNEGDLVNWRNVKKVYRPFTAPSTFWQQPANQMGVGTATAVTSGQLSFVPLDVGPLAKTFSNIGVGATVAQVAGTTTTTVGIYPDDGTGSQPYTLNGPTFSGTITLTATGNRTASLSSLTLQPGRYWLAFLYVATVAPTTAASIYTISNAVNMPINSGTTIGSASSRGWFLAAQTVLPAVGTDIRSSLGGAPGPQVVYMALQAA